jgi:steroid delta-isomerase-like uncharacterized protein
VEAELLTPGQTVLNAWKVAWERGEFSALDAVLSPNYVRRGRASASVQSRQRFKASIAAQRAAFTDLTWNVVDAVESPGRLAVRWQMSGTHTARFLGVPASGRRITLTGATFARIAHDEVIEEWVTYDRRDLLRSLGIPLGLTSTDEPSSSATLHNGSADIEVVRAALDQLVTGAIAVTVDRHGVPMAIPVSAFSSISLDPPLVVVCVQKSSAAHEALAGSEHFAVNVLSAGQRKIAQALGSGQRKQFTSIRWHFGRHGCPVIDDACAYLELETGERLQAGTHTVFVGRVVDAGHFARPPLLLRGGQFFDGQT